MEDESKKQKALDTTLWGVCMALGAGVGTALGVALGNIGIGVGIGAGIGLAIGLLLSARKANRNDD